MLANSIPKYVLHDGERWKIVGSADIDGDEGLELKRPGQPLIVARVSETSPYIKGRTRRLKDDGFVLEYNERGQVFIRKTRSRKRFETSLPAIYSMTVKSHVAMENAYKAINKRRKKQGKPPIKR